MGLNPMSLVSGLMGDAGMADAIGSIEKSAQQGMALSNAATQAQMQMQETTVKNDVKKQAVKMLADAAKPAQ
ncbi:hypothetical protein Bsp3421_002588 [Burkholderia sp. FERM BP-3421]|jgi:hypothetical protein|uniref:hypothetical protein n=1 Tax=Burkholderia sp. FERM BP-3421 TaxID=1494466 RepID=UPI002360A8FB|nr:hypothetical protein [Burkholderia sp. FERM BP-3421]WDD92573.1 hypothetical protein Bsp3421_002588 [Burkholderia sp. FERM BP-3421]